MNVVSELTRLENEQLVRQLIAEDPAYIFKHALVQDAAYHSLLKQDRQHLHRVIGQALERAYPDRLDELAAIIAGHFESADDARQALAYLDRAAAWARRAFAHQEQAALLARAIALAERTGDSARVADLYARRGNALLNLSAWQDAKRDLEAALEHLASDALAERASVLLDLADAYRWLWDTATEKRLAEEALALAERTGREDLICDALCEIAFAHLSDGRTQQALELYERAFGRAGKTHAASIRQGYEFAGLAHYWVGNSPAAVEYNQNAVQLARETFDTFTLTRGWSNLALAQMMGGAYGAALDAFREVREFARQHGGGAWFARAVAMEGGMYLDLFDYAHAESLAFEARDLARRFKFPPAAVSAAIDLMFNYTRRGEMNRAEKFGREVAEAIPATYGNHRWLWENRFVQARAELALARGDDANALELATESLAQSRATNRVKYQTAALETRAKALARQNRRREAIADLRAAVELARPTGDPLMFLRAVAALAALEGDDLLSSEARARARQISDALPAGNLRARFQAFAAEWLGFAEG